MSQINSDYKKLFLALYEAGTEQEIEELIIQNPDVFDDSSNWKPLGGNPSNYGVIENQQSNPIAALIEKITNSIDATLTKRCLEENIDPKSENAPRSMSDAVDLFFSG